MANFAPFVLAVAALALPCALHAADGVISAATATQSIAAFSANAAGSVLAEWTVQPIRKVKQVTQYALVRDEEINRTVLEAVADAAAGAAIYRIDASARATPILRFSWKVGNLIVGSDPTTKAGDDYAARVYVTFAHDPARASLREKAENGMAQLLYGETPPHAALTYVFTHKLALGSVVTSPFTSRAKMIAVDTDPALVGKWRQFERDVYADYRRAFGEEPTRISGIAIMVDTDNTGERARSRFGDVSLSAR